MKINFIAGHTKKNGTRRGEVIRAGKHNRFLQLTMALGIFYVIGACGTVATVRQQDLDAWVGVPVEALNTHPFFKDKRMFRTRTHGGTEIRNYSYGYNFGECFGKVGADKVGDFVDEDIFIRCSSGRIVCNNLFYIRNGTVLEYAPTGLCATDKTIRPEASYLSRKSR